MSRRPIAVLAMALAGLLSAPAGAQSTAIPLTPGQPQQITLPAGQITTSWVVDVPAGITHMRLELAATNPSHDVDLLLRKHTPFELRAEANLGVDVNQLFDQAHYRSAGELGDEFLVIDAANAIPLSEGRWYLGLINFASVAADARLSLSLAAQAPVADIQFVFDSAGSSQRPCDTSGWNSSEPRTPERGNPGTTLGEQRRFAAQEAARLLTQQVRPRVPVRVEACWNDLGDASGTASLWPRPAHRVCSSTTSASGPTCPASSAATPGTPRPPPRSSWEPPAAASAEAAAQRRSTSARPSTTVLTRSVRPPSTTG